MTERTELERLVALETHIADMNGDLKEIAIGMLALRESVVARPSWAVLSYITILTSVCAGLLVTVVSLVK